MTINDKKVIYQRILVDDYRLQNPEDTECLTDDEVALMCPITDMDVICLLEAEKVYVQKKIDMLNLEIEGDMEILNNPKTFHEELTEIRSDIRYERSQVEMLKQKIEELDEMAKGLEGSYGSR